MAVTRYSVATGDWNNTATWSSSHAGAPGASVPGTGDTAYVEGGFSVTVTAQQPILSARVKGGALILNTGVGFTFDDNAAAALWVYDDDNTNIVTNGTTAAPCICQSENLQPTNKWLMFFYDKTPDTRVFTLTGLELRGNRWFLGNDNLNLQFNNGDTGPFMLTVTPAARTPKIIEHDIPWRATSRIYKQGNRAGAIQCTGTLKWSGNDWATLASLRDTTSPICLVTQYVIIPRCRVESLVFSPTPGSLWLPFKLTLVEDI